MTTINDKSGGRMRLASVLAIFLMTVLTGCGNPGQQPGRSEAQQKTVEMGVEKVKDAAAQQPVLASTRQAMIEETASEGAFQPFYVFTNKGSRQNHYVPSGFMPDGNCVTFSDMWQEKCYTEKTCIRVVYDVQCSRVGQKWVGIYWLNPANNWGTRKGGYNLQGATKLTFWAKGEKGGEQIQEFTVGGISGDYPDSDTAVIGPVILSDQWRQYTIDLRGKDLSYISGGFSWTSSEEVNPEDCTFYLDEIRFE